MCGDNGTGKSSFVDAIEKVLASRCGSLDTGDQAISWTRYGKHAKSSQPASAELTLTDGQRDYQLSISGIRPSQPSELRALLAAAAGQSFILRRRNILKYVDAKPAERGRAIEGLLQLGSYTEFEAKLKKLCNEARQTQTEMESRWQFSVRKLKAALGLSEHEQLDANTCLRALNGVVANTGLATLASLDDVQPRIGACKELLAQFGDMSGLQHAVALSGAVAAVPPIREVLAGGDTYAQAHRALLEEEGRQKGHFHEEVLSKGLAWIKEDRLDKCPLCGHAIDRAAVEAHVNRRIAANQTFIIRDKDLSKYHDAFRVALDRFTTALRAVSEKWMAAIGVAFPEQGRDVLEKAVRLADKHRQRVAPDDTVADVKSLRAADVDSVVGALRKMAEEKVQSFKDGGKYEALLKAQAVLESFADGWRELTQNDARLGLAKEKAEQLAIVLDLAEKARKKVVRDVIAAVATEADRYFQQIHQNESIGRPELSVPERGIGSVELTAVFYGEKVDPRGTYSEGHLDSLGLCIFLAVRRLHHRQHPELALLILDDVMHSVDGAHRRATARLVLQEFRDHQLVITTHDPLWFEYLKEACRQYDPTREYNKLRIAGWSITEGPSWGDHLSDFEWLSSTEAVAARPADRAVKAGRLLEELLLNLCDALKVAVPFRIKGDYTIDPLWGPFYKKAKGHDEFWSKARQALEAIESLRKLRNWSAHWSEWAAQLTANEAREFTEAVVNLRGLVFCPQCGVFVAQIEKLPGVWSCPREHVRYCRKSPPAVEVCLSVVRLPRKPRAT